MCIFKHIQDKTFKQPLIYTPNLIESMVLFIFGCSFVFIITIYNKYKKK